MGSMPVPEWYLWPGGAFPQNISLSSLCSVISTSKTGRIKKKADFLDLDLDCHLVDIWLHSLVGTKHTWVQIFLGNVKTGTDFTLFTACPHFTKGKLEAQSIK